MTNEKKRQTMAYMKTQKLTVRVEGDIENGLEKMMLSYKESRSMVIRLLLREALANRGWLKAENKIEEWRN